MTEEKLDRLIELRKEITKLRAVIGVLQTNPNNVKITAWHLIQTTDITFPEQFAHDFAEMLKSRLAELEIEFEES